MKTTMQSIINDSFGPIEDDIHEIYRYSDDLARSMVMLSSARVYSYETAGGVMFDWVMEPDFDEE